MRSIKDYKTVRTENADDSLKNKTDALASKYAGKSESELMQALMQNVSAAKNSGTFSEEQLDEFVGFVSPNLDEQSLTRLKELVRMIKGNG